MIWQRDGRGEREPDYSSAAASLIIEGVIVPARRNRPKTRATETPLAAIAPTMPNVQFPVTTHEDADDGCGQCIRTATHDEATAPEDAETVETVPLAPRANTPGVRKAGNRRRGGRTAHDRGTGASGGGPAPQRCTDETMDVTTGAEDEATADSEDDVPVAERRRRDPSCSCHYALSGITIAAMWLLAAFVPQASSSSHSVRASGATRGGSVLYHAWYRRPPSRSSCCFAHGTVYSACRLTIFTGARSVWHWRGRCRPVPMAQCGAITGVRPRSLPCSAWFLGGIFVWQAVSHPSASNLLSLLGFLVTLFAKAITAVIFVGFLQRALTARFPKSRAALLAGAAYGIANAVLLAAVLAAPIQARPAPCFPRRK